MKSSISNRIIVGKSLGFVLGGLAFFFLTRLNIPISTEFMLGLWFFYIILGAVIGLMGSMTHHPIFKFRMRAGFRGAIMGMVMHLMLVLLAFDQISQIAVSINIFNMHCPYWALLDGVIIGCVMDLIVTKYAGEGEIQV